ADLGHLGERGRYLLLARVPQPLFESQENTLRLVLTRADDEWEAEAPPVGGVEASKGGDLLGRQSVESGGGLLGRRGAAERAAACGTANEIRMGADQRHLSLYRRLHHDPAERVIERLDAGERPRRPGRRDDPWRPLEEAAERGDEFLALKPVDAIEGLGAHRRSPRTNARAMLVGRSTSSRRAMAGSRPPRTRTRP